mgnify:CR=1 FL=1
MKRETQIKTARFVVLGIAWVVSLARQVLLLLWRKPVRRVPENVHVLLERRVRVHHVSLVVHTLAATGEKLAQVEEDGLRLSALQSELLVLSGSADNVGGDVLHQGDLLVGVRARPQAGWAGRLSRRTPTFTNMPKELSSR